MNTLWLSLFATFFAVNCGGVVSEPAPEPQPSCLDGEACKVCDLDGVCEDGTCRQTEAGPSVCEQVCSVPGPIGCDGLADSAPCGDGSWSCSSGNCIPTAPACKTDSDCPAKPCHVGACNGAYCIVVQSENGAICPCDGVCVDGACEVAP